MSARVSRDEPNLGGGVTTPPLRHQEMRMSGIEYRHFQPGDEKGIIELLPDQWLQGCQGGVCYLNDPNLDPESVRLAIHNGKIVGHVQGILYPVFIEGKFQKFGWIDTLFVSPQIRGKGIGTELVKQIIRYFEGKGCRGILLTVEKDSIAHSIYRKLGFTDLITGIYTLLHPEEGESRIKLTPAEVSDVDEMKKLYERWIRRVFPVFYYPSNLSVDKIPERIAMRILSKYRIFRRGDKVVGYTRWSEGGGGGVRDPRSLDEDVEEMVRAVQTAVRSPVRWYTSPGSRYETYLRRQGYSFEPLEEVIMLRPIGEEIDLGDMEVTFWGIYW